MQKNASGPLSYTTHKNYSRWIKNLNARLETIGEVNIGSKHSDISLGNIITDLSPQTRATKAEINKWHYIKQKSFCTVKSSILKDHPYKP